MLSVIILYVLRKLLSVIFIFLPFIGINQLTHWLFPLLSIGYLFINSFGNKINYLFIKVAILFLVLIALTGLVSGNIYNPARKFSEIVLLMVWTVQILTFRQINPPRFSELVILAGQVFAIYILSNISGFSVRFSEMIVGKNGIALFLFVALYYSITIRGLFKISSFIIVSAILISGSLKVIISVVALILYELFKKNFKGVIVLASLSAFLLIQNFGRVNQVLMNSETYVFAFSKAQAYLGLTPDLPFASDYKDFRADLIKGGLDLFKQHWFTGIGLENSRLYLPTYTHNNYVELMCSLGILGLPVFFMFLLPLYRYGITEDKSTYLMLFLFLVIGWTNRLYDNYSYFLFITIFWVNDRKASHISH